jgi:hypothetical protein
LKERNICNVIKVKCYVRSVPFFGRKNDFETVCKETRANGLCQEGKGGAKESITEILEGKVR